MLNCPLCALPLEAVERQGIELDHCPSCGGLWLDAGELDALIEREAVAALRQGERVLMASRRGKEYDHAVYETDEYGGRHGMIPGFGAKFVVSAGYTRTEVEAERELALR
jgi:Zn-finger nucleic acid-binding protein